MSKKQNIRRGIGLAVILSIASIYFIFLNIKGVSLSFNLRHLNWYYYIGGLFVLGMVWFAKAYRMYVISQGMGQKVNLINYFQIYMATCFISHVTPFNSGGTPLQIYLLTKQGVALGKASAITVVDLGLNTLMFLFLVGLAVILNLQMLRQGNLAVFNHVSIFDWSLWFLVLGIVSYLLIRIIRQPQFLKSNWVGRITLFVKRKGWLNHFQKEYGLFKEGWRVLVRENPRSIIGAIVATVIYWLFYLLLAPIVIWTLGHKVSFLGIMGWQLFFNFVQLLIPTPGGSGGSELLLSYFYKNIIGIELVGMFVLLWKIYTFFSTLLIGSVFFIKLTRTESTVSTQIGKK